MKRLWIASLWLAVTACCAQKPVPQNTYVDQTHGVSFQYPKAWSPTDSVTYFGNSLDKNTAKLMASFTFSPKGNLYEKTILMELVFSYYVMPASSLKSCVQQANAGVNADGAPKKVQINGVPFTEVSGVNAGMCHSRASQMDMTWRSGQCLVFERDFDQECFGADESKRQLTAREEKALQRHLDETMQSVRLAR